MIELVFTYLFGLGITLCFAFGLTALKQFPKLKWINPMLFSVVFIIALLQNLDIPYADYKKGADLIHSFLGPITVILAVPLYEYKDQLIQHKYAILGGALLGSFSALSAVYLIGSSLDLSKSFVHSLMPKSITTPIGITASELLEGIVGLSVMSIVITGIFGSIIAPLIFKLLGIKSDVARGVALGTTSHAIGTAKAYELSSQAGAMSGVSIALAGIFSIFWILLYTLL